MRGNFGQFGGNIEGALVAGTFVATDAGRSLNSLKRTRWGRVMMLNGIRRMGNARWGCAAMLLGLPLPLVIIAFLFGGCNH
jgi:hypothetical protein